MPTSPSSLKTTVASREADRSHREQSKPPKSREGHQWEFRSALMVGICVTRCLRPYCTPCSRYTH